MLEERYTAMQNPHHHTDDKFVMNFGSFDTDALFNPNMGHVPTMGGQINLGGIKRTAHEAFHDRDLDGEGLGLSSDDDLDLKKEVKHHATSTPGRIDVPTHIPHHVHANHQPHQTALDHGQMTPSPSQDSKQTVLPNGKKTKGRVKIKMEFIDNKLRRYTTFSKRKTGIMKKAYELSTLTGTQVMLLVASETGHVYTFATRKLQPMITSEAGKALIQTCLNSPDPNVPISHHDQRMSATGYEETELTYAVADEENKVRQLMYSNSLPNSMNLTAGGISNMSSSQMPSPSQGLGIGSLSQSHHHQHYHPSQTPTPHPPPTSSNHPLCHSPHHLPLPPHSSHSMPPTPHSSQNSDHDHIGSVSLINHHPSHLSSNPLPPQSPLPPHSPITSTSPYSLLHHHPHHSLSHNR